MHFKDCCTIYGLLRKTSIVLVARDMSNFKFLKARLHRRFLSRQLDAIFVALKLQQVSNMFETPAISRRQIALKIALVYTCDFGAAT